MSSDSSARVLDWGESWESPSDGELGTVKEMQEIKRDRETPKVIETQRDER
jgi:hypothetical protein